MTTSGPRRPHLARELVARAAEAAERRPLRVRNQLDAVEAGQSRHIDHANTNWLRRVLAGSGCWPGYRLVGPEAERAAFLIALYSDHDPPFQRVATTLIKRAVQADDAPIQHWAHLHDRALVNSGYDQAFGTQLRRHKAGIELCPLSEPQYVDQRRASVGLPSIAIALEAIRRRYAPDRAVDSPTIELANAA